MASRTVAKGSKMRARRQPGRADKSVARPTAVGNNGYPGAGGSGNTDKSGTVGGSSNAMKSGTP